MRYKVTDPEGQAEEDSRQQREHAPSESPSNPAVYARLVVIIALVATALVALAATVALLATVNVKTGEKMAQYRTAIDSCLSEDCVISAARVLESVDRSTEPCHDFYQFACGGWIKKHPVPETQSSWDQFWSLREALLKDIRELLEEEGREDDVKQVKQARALYRTCLNTDKLEQLGVEPMLRVMRQLDVSPRPPRPRQADDEKFDWVYTVGRAQRLLGLNILYGFWVSQDIRNTSRNLMVVDQISPGISERYLLDPARFHTELSEYRRYIEDMVHVFEASLRAKPPPPPSSTSPPPPAPTTTTTHGEAHQQQKYEGEDASGEDGYHGSHDGEEDDDDHYYAASLKLPLLHEAAGGPAAKEFADDILKFSSQLASIMTTAEARRDPRNLFHEMKIPHLNQLTDIEDPGANVKMNWTRYLSYVFQDTNVTIDEETDVVVVMEMAYLQKLSGLLAKTDPTTLERFVWWSIFSTLAPLTLQEFRDLAFRFSKQVFGLTQKTPRWKGCTGNVNSNFGMAVSYLYVQKHFNNNSRNKALEMVNDIRDAFVEMVGELQWMDDETKQRTLDKAHAMRPFIGFPGWLLTPGKLGLFYQKVEIEEGQLFESYLKLSATTQEKTLEDLRKTPDYNRWVTPATTVNAFYSPILNSVTFPAGILQPPFYGLGLESLNYGAIGAIMGHELTHGFDDQGRRYDKHGNLKQWWTEKTLVEYEQRVQCIVEQYSQYNVTQLGDNFTVNGINTQGENIADNGGLREALRAYRMFRARQDEHHDKILPGLAQFSPEQLFFLGFAHMWCGNSTRGALKSRVVDGVHSPNRYRVIGTLSNSVEFSEAWNCPPGSPMNPEKKCVLW